jgi:hypothetical protein
VRRGVAAGFVVGLGACSGATLPNATTVFETIGVTEDDGDDGDDDDDDDDGSSGTTGIDPTNAEGDSGEVDSSDTTSSTGAVDTTGPLTADGGSSSSGEVDDGPMETSTTEPDVSLACVDDDLGNDVGDAIASGNSSAGDDYTISCAGGGGADVVLSWTAPSAGSWTFDLSGSSYDTALALVQPDCDGGELGCSDDAIGLTSMLTVDLGAGEDVLVVVDGYDGAVGSYVLDVNPAADLSCADEDLLDGFGAAIASGTTVGENDSYSLGCLATDGADVALAWIAPSAGTWTFSLAGSSYDTAIALRSPDCGGDEIACNDDGPTDLTSVLDVDLVAGERLIIVVDGYQGATGSFSLSIQ